jgi:hypothetical protein
MRFAGAIRAEAAGHVSREEAGNIVMQIAQTATCVAIGAKASAKPMHDGERHIRHE